MSQTDPGSSDDNSSLKGLCPQRLESPGGAKTRERPLPRYVKPAHEKKSGEGRSATSSSGHSLASQMSSLRLTGGSSSSSRDTLEVVYEVSSDGIKIITQDYVHFCSQESDEDTNSVFSNDDDLAQLIHNNNNNNDDATEELNSKSALIASSPSCCRDSVLNEDEWRALKKDLDNSCVLIRKLTSKEGLKGGSTSSRTPGGVLDGVGETVQIYPLAGAFLGSCLGGPVGFLAGVKIGGLAAVGGGILGEIEQ